MQKNICCVLMLIILFSFTACTTEKKEDNIIKVSTKKPEDIKVGVSLSSERKEKGLGELDYLKNIGADYGFLVITVDVVKDGKKQIDKCKDLLGQNIDSLILKTEDKGTAREIINMAHEKGVKVILYDQYVNYAAPDYYVTFDWEKAGKLQVDSLIENMPKGKYIWLKSRFKKQFTQDLLVKGQEASLKPYTNNGDIEVVYSNHIFMEKEDEGYIYIKDAANKTGQDFQAVITPSDKIAQGIVKGLEELNMKDKVLIAGLGGDISACERIIKNEQISTIYMPLDKLAESVMEVARSAAKAKDPKKEVDSKLGVWKKYDNEYIEMDTFLVDIIKVTEDNLLECIVKDGYHSINEVYKNIPSKEWPKLKKLY